MVSKGNLGDMEGAFTPNRFAFVPYDELSYEELEMLTTMVSEMDN